MKNTVNENSNTLVIIKMIATAFFWGATFIGGRICASYGTPQLFGFLRFFLASLFLLGIVAYKKGFKPLSFKEFIFMCILALTGVFAYNMFFFWGLQSVVASRASLIIANNPLFIALGAAVFLKERLKPIQLLGVFLSITGALITISGGNLAMIFNTVSYGDLAILGCVASWVTYSLVGKVVLKTLSPILAVTWSCVIGTFIFFPLIFTPTLVHDIMNFPLQVWLSIFFIGFCGTALAFVWFYEAVNVLGASKAGVFINFVPLTGVVLSILMLGEHLNFSMIIGGSLTICGVYITNRKPQHGNAISG